MNKIGFYYKGSDSTQIYRGMDVYAHYLYQSLHEESKHSNIELVQLEDNNLNNTDDLKLIHFPSFSLFKPEIPWWISVPYLVTVHDVTRLEFSDHYPKGMKGNLILLYQKFILSRAKCIITDSYSSVHQLTKYLRIPHSKIKMIYLAHPQEYKPISSQKFLKSISQKYSLPSKFVLFNGDIDWNKNLQNLIKVCKDLDVDLVLYGKAVKRLHDSPESFDLSHKELTHLAGLLPELKSNKIHLLGFVPESDLVGIFNLATVYCHPSYAEGFGLPVLQAMACGTPVVCSFTHSLPEIADEAVEYCNPWDSESIKQSLSKVLASIDVQKKLSSAGIIQASKFNWQKVAKNTLMVYKDYI